MGLARYAGPSTYVGNGPRRSSSAGFERFPCISFGGVLGRSGLERLRETESFQGLSFSGFPGPCFVSQQVFSGEDVSPGVVGRGILETLAFTCFSLTRSGGPGLKRLWWTSLTKPSGLIFFFFRPPLPHEPEWDWSPLPHG